MTNCNALPPSSPLFSSLPDEVIVDCLARVSKSYYGSICLVSKSFYSLLSSPEIYVARSHIGATEPRLYVCLSLPNNHGWFSLGEIEGELSLVPVRLSSSTPPARFKSTTVAVGSEIYLIGGTVEGKRTRSVFVLDCGTHTWRRAPNLGVSRVGAKSCYLEGKIYVIGGCRKRGEQSMNWGEVFDLKTQTWKPLPCPGDVALRSNHKVVVFGGRLYVITKRNNYAYDPKEERWLSKVGFVDLQPIIGTRSGSIEKVMKRIKGPWCVIENVMFTEEDRYYKWYCSLVGAWLRVQGLNDVYQKRGLEYRTIQLVNYGGKLLIIWHDSDEHIKSIDKGFVFSSQEESIGCAVIRLEERLADWGPEMWGEIERCNFVVPTVPANSNYNLSSCQCVSV